MTDPRDIAFSSPRVLALRVRMLRERLEDTATRAIDYERWSMALCSGTPTEQHTPLDGFDELMELEAVLRRAAQRLFRAGRGDWWGAWVQHRLAGCALRDACAKSAPTAHRWISAVDEEVWSVMQEWEVSVVYEERGAGGVRVVHGEVERG